MNNTFPEEGQQLEVPIGWPTWTTQNAQPANQFLLMPGPPLADGSTDGVYMVVGNFIPPIALNESDMQRVLAESNGTLQVTALGTFYMSDGRLRELHAAISRHLEAAEGREHS